MNVLAIGAHPDDIELGCGAALVGHRRGGHRVTLLVMTTGERGPQDARSRVQEQEDAAALLGADLLWGRFVDGEVPDGRPAVDVIEEALRISGADVVYTHAPNDSHQDHRATSVASLAACRRLSSVLMYESPTSVGFTPSVFVDAKGLVENKLDLLRAHVSQVLKNGLVDLEAVESQARYRGFQARLRHAEGFVVDRFRWDPAPAAPAPRAEVDLDLSLAEVSA
ncbi:MAG: PIG-L family deacetylase [Acidimicrobiia bacterium]|nr:PIG-L family deacetylase [Acidimicrobiia bacterium]MBV9040389.1 PIG-L family deacetylase [Acidimicrobiia bacterium]